MTQKRQATRHYHRGEPYLLYRGHLVHKCQDELPISPKEWEDDDFAFLFLSSRRVAIKPEYRYYRPESYYSRHWYAAGEGWYWQDFFEEVKRQGPFPTLEECLDHAEEAGYEDNTELNKWDGYVTIPIHYNGSRIEFCEEHEADGAVLIREHSDLERLALAAYYPKGVYWSVAEQLLEAWNAYLRGEIMMYHVYEAIFYEEGDINWDATLAVGPLTSVGDFYETGSADVWALMKEDAFNWIDAEIARIESQESA